VTSASFSLWSTMKALLPLTAFSTMATIVLAAFWPLRPAIAQQLPTLPLQFDPTQLVNPGRPGGRRRGGASRGGCPADSDLTAIAAASRQTVRALDVDIPVETVGSLTSLARPNLLFYLPVPLSERTRTLVVIKSEQGAVLYEGQLSGETDRAGVVSVPLPVDLAPGNRYEWFLTVDCGEGEQTSVNGWIANRAIDPSLQRSLRQATPRNRAALYADAGFLQDTLSELAALRLANPDDEPLAQYWVSLLNLLELSDIAIASLLDCCQLTDISDISETSETSETSEISPSSPNNSPDEASEETSGETAKETAGETAEETTETEPAETRTILQRARDRG